MSSDQTEPKRARHNLGRGLAALFGEQSEDYAEADPLRQSRTVPVALLRPSRFQPRHGFDEERLGPLVESVREKGVLQPILVRRHGQEPETYEIVAGERRWRAAQLAQLHEVPVIVKVLSDGDALEIALVENLQRQDLNPVEEAEGYRRLMEEFEHTQKKLARAVGKSRSHVANTMRLLNLPGPVKQMLEEGALSASHGRALINADHPALLALQVVRRGLNVRQTERLVQKTRDTGEKGKRRAVAAVKDADTLALERNLSKHLGLKVTITFDGSGGAISIRYRTLEQLDDVIRRLHPGLVSPAARRNPDTDPAGPLGNPASVAGGPAGEESDPGEHTVPRAAPHDASGSDQAG